MTTSFIGTLEIIVFVNVAFILKTQNIFSLIVRSIHKPADRAFYVFLILIPFLLNHLLTVMIVKRTLKTNTFLKKSSSLLFSAIVLIRDNAINIARQCLVHARSSLTVMTLPIFYVNFVMFQIVIANIY